jgi:hypothetical protein
MRPGGRVEYGNNRVQEIVSGTQKTGHEKLIQKHAVLSPVPEFKKVPREKGEIVAFQMIFGRRERKPKWTG